jgi:hypothetical protein
MQYQLMLCDSKSILALEPVLVDTLSLFKILGLLRMRGMPVDQADSAVVVLPLLSPATKGYP